jgi:hypothetical protein
MAARSLLSFLFLRVPRAMEKPIEMYPASARLSELQVEEPCSTSQGLREVIFSHAYYALNFLSTCVFPTSRHSFAGHSRIGPRSEHSICESFCPQFISTTRHSLRLEGSVEFVTPSLKDATSFPMDGPNIDVKFGVAPLCLYH